MDATGRVPSVLLSEELEINGCLLCILEIELEIVKWELEFMGWVELESTGTSEENFFNSSTSCSGDSVSITLLCTWVCWITLTSVCSKGGLFSSKGWLSFKILEGWGKVQDNLSDKVRL